MLFGFSAKGFENSLERGDVFSPTEQIYALCQGGTVLFSLHKRKEPKEVCNLAG